MKIDKQTLQLRKKKKQPFDCWGNLGKEKKKRIEFHESRPVIVKPKQ